MLQSPLLAQLHVTSYMLMTLCSSSKLIRLVFGGFKICLGCIKTHWASVSTSGKASCLWADAMPGGLIWLQVFSKSMLLHYPQHTWVSPYSLALPDTFIFKRLWTGWKTKCLSFVGRLTLDRHVLSSIPLYISIVLPLPRKTCLQIERLMSYFLWSANPDKSRSSLVRWDTVCLPKAEGGLGLRRVTEFKEAYLLFLAWSAISVDLVWANWFRGRYFKGLPI